MIVTHSAASRPTSTGLGRVFSAMSKAIAGLFAFLRDLAKELADENAYSRHLSWHRREPSSAEWRAFSDSRLKSKYQQGKCC